MDKWTLQFMIGLLPSFTISWPYKQAPLNLSAITMTGEWWAIKGLLILTPELLKMKSARLRTYSYIISTYQLKSQ